MDGATENLLAQLSLDRIHQFIELLKTVRDRGINESWLNFQQLAKPYEQLVANELVKDERYNLVMIKITYDKLVSLGVPVSITAVAEAITASKTKVLDVIHSQIYEINDSTFKTILNTAEAFATFNISWPEFNNILGKTTEQKTKIITYILLVVKSDGPAARKRMLRSIDSLYHIGINWPELAIIKRSLLADHHEFMARED
jgi:hypothetical protein